MRLIPAYCLLREQRARALVIENYHAAAKVTNAEMSAFNPEVADKLYSFLLLVLHPRYAKARENAILWLYPPQWDQPKFDKSLRFLLRRSRKGIMRPFATVHSGPLAPRGGEVSPPPQ